MNKKNIKSAESYALDRDDKNHFSFALFSFYYILPLLCFFMALGLFVFRYKDLKITSENIDFFKWGVVSVFGIVLSLLFYGRIVFTKRQLIKRVNLMNITMLGLWTLFGLFIVIFIFPAHEFAFPNHYFEYLLNPLTAPTHALPIAFFLISSLSYFVLISLPPQLFKTPQNDSHLKRNTIIFYVIFLFFFYFPIAFSMITNTIFLDGPDFFYN